MNKEEKEEEPKEEEWPPVVFLFMVEGKEVTEEEFWEIYDNDQPSRSVHDQSDENR